MALEEFNRNGHGVRGTALRDGVYTTEARNYQIALAYFKALPRAAYRGKAIATRVGDGVGRHVGVGMAGQPSRMIDPDAAEDQRGRPSAKA
jgi:hypothetical protein